MRRQRSLALAALLLGAAACGAHAAAAKQQQQAGADLCPFTYSYARDSVPGGLLLSGVLHPNVDCKAGGGAVCPRLASKERDGHWVQECSFPTSLPAFGVCSEQQRAAGLDMAQKLHGGAALQASPCELFSYIRGRTLWLVGDSHTKQLFRAMTCFMYDFWDGKNCLVTPDQALVKQLDTMPMMPGETKCIHLLGDTRICRIGAVLGSSLVNNPALPEHGVLNILRNKGLADPKDIFVVQFGLWHLLEGPPGLDKFKDAMQKLAENYERTKAQWPHLIVRDTPMRHERDGKTCRPAAAGWTFDYASGTLQASDNARSAAAALLARGGVLNAPAHEILERYNVPQIGGFAYSVPLHVAHPATRGTGADVDCIHYCHFGVPELHIYELLRGFRAGVAGVAPLPAAALPPLEARRVCAPLLANY